MRLAVSLAALLASSPALAGGIGPLVMGGIHTERVTYYSSRADNGNGARFDNIDEYDQFVDQQIVGHLGSGLELMLGDRDDLIQGTFRLYWMMDTPQADPVERYGDTINPEALVANVREEAKHQAVGTVGLQWGILRAAADKFKLGASLHIGSGFFTNNRTEFFLVQPGANVSYAASRTLEVYLDATYGLRVSKLVSHGLYATAGVRVMFD